MKRLTLLVLFTLASCAPFDRGYVAGCLNRMTFYHVKTLDLCFGACGAREPVWVPCTDEVLSIAESVDGPAKPPEPPLP